MVGTRSHPKGDYPATPTPPSKSAATTPATTGTVARRAASRGPAARTAWTHTPSTLTLVWLAVSLPLVAWDTAYVLGRPHTMPGGWAHRPLFVPYALYGAVDHVYGAPALASRDGFGGAQAAMNAVETAGYLVYLFIVAVNGVQGKGKGRGAPSALQKALGGLARPRVVSGRAAAVAPVLGLLMAALTLAKTVLYWLNEAFSGFKHIGHNSAFDLFTLWIVPNGMWLIFPTYMIYVFWNEIVEGLENSAGVDSKKRN